MSTNLQFQSVGPMPLQDGSLYLNVQYTIPAPVGAVTTQALALGDNTVNVPAGVPTTVIIQPPAGNTQTIKIKGAGPDTGLNLHKTAPTFLSLDVTVTSFILNAGGAIANVAFTWL